MDRLKLKKIRRDRRKKHIRKTIRGSKERPRLTVYRSLKQIYAQIVDDTVGKTLVAASSVDKELKSQIKPEMKKTEKSVLVGKLLAERALAAGIKKVAFDRNGYLYHGRIKALADAAREGGLEF